MKLVCSKSALLSGVQIVSKAVPSKTTMSILECILVDASRGIITLTANDMELGIETTIEGNIIEKGIIALDAKIFLEIVRKLPDSDITIETDRTYEIKVVVDGARVKGYIDGELYFDYDFGVKAQSKAYTVVSNDDNGDIIIKLVNVTEKASPVAINIANANIDGTAIINQVAGDSLKNDNILGAEEDCIMKEFTLSGFSNQFNYTMPAYSVTSIKLKTK